MMKKNPLFGFFALILAVVFTIALTSAAVDFYPASITGSVQQGNIFTSTFIIYNDYNTPLTSITYTAQNLASSSNTITTTPSVSGLPSTIQNNTNSSIVTYSIYIPSNQPIGTYSGNLTLKGNYSSATLTDKGTLPITLTVTSNSTAPAPTTSDYCEFGKVGDLKLDSITIENSGTGDDEEWHPLDGIQITVDIKNMNSDDRVNDVLVDLKILDKSGNDVTSDFNLDDEEIDIGAIKSKDIETVVFNIAEVPSNVDEGEYKIYIKAFSDGDEGSQCISDSNDFNKDSYQSIDYVRAEDPAVIVKSTNNKLSASCGDKNVPVSFNIYNIGSDKEDKVLVTIESSQLGVSETQFIGNLNSGKSKEVNFFMDLPQDLSKTSYNLDIKTYFDYRGSKYDENNVDSYDTNSDDVDGSYSIKVEILNCQIPQPSINAKLSSVAKIGEDLVLDVTVKNNANTAKDLTLSLSNYDWADSVNIVPQTASLSAGESKDFVITLSPTIEGAHSFKIIANLGGQTFEQPVSVNIAKKSGIFGQLDNTTLYLIIAIGVLVILIILILLIRFARR